MVVLVVDGLFILLLQGKRQLLASIFVREPIAKDRSWPEAQGLDGHHRRNDESPDW
jgi:hypothetical protein